MEKPVRYGVIGIGGMGANHAQKLQENKIENAILAAVADSKVEYKNKYENIPFFENTDNFFDNKIIDAAIIATPHKSHIDLAKKALENNINVIIEKPLAITSKKCREFINISQSFKAFFTVMLNQRTNPVYVKIKELINGNELGKVHRFQWTITNWFRTNYYYQTSNWRAKWESEGGGVLINQSIHQLDLCQWLFGMPDSVYTDLGLGRFHEIEVEDEVTSIFKYKNGLKGVFITTTGEAPGVNRLEIASDKGLITIQDNNVTWEKIDSSTEFIKNSKTLFGMPKKEKINFNFKADLDQHIEHQRLIQNFTNFLLGKEKLLVNGKDGLNSVELINAMVLSGLEEKKIELPLDEVKYEQKLEEMISKSR